MDAEIGSPDPGDVAKPRGRRRVRRDGVKAAKGPIMSERVPLNVKISRRSKISLDAHANLWRGTPRGTASGIIDSLISEHLKEIRISHHASDGEAETGQDGKGGGPS